MDSQKVKFYAKRPASGSAEIIKHNEKLADSGWKTAQDQDQFLMNETKLPWHKDRLLAWVNDKNNASLVPLHIDMGIATGCNLACHFCYGVVQARTGFQGTQGAMELMPLETIINTFKNSKEIGVKSIALIGEGENTLNPNLYPALSYAKSIDLDVSLATHGASLRDKHYQTLLESLSWLRINISAATPESYKYVHQRPWFDKVINNTLGLLGYRDRNDVRLNNGEKCTIGYQMVLTNRNFEDIIPLSVLAVELGIDYLVIKACSDTPEGSLEAPTHEYLKLKEKFFRAESLSNERTKIIVRWEKLGNLGNKSYKNCYGTRFIIAISGNGNVFPCGHWFNIEKDRFLMGNVNQTPFKDIIKSQTYINSQKEILKLDLRSCESNCRQHQVNSFLDHFNQIENPMEFIDSMLVSSPPKHLNFI